MRLVLNLSVYGTDAIAIKNAVLHKAFCWFESKIDMIYLLRRLQVLDKYLVILVC